MKNKIHIIQQLPYCSHGSDKDQVVALSLSNSHPNYKEISFVYAHVILQHCPFHNIQHRVYHGYTTIVLSKSLQFHLVE